MQKASLSVIHMTLSFLRNVLEGVGSEVKLGTEASNARRAGIKPESKSIKEHSTSPPPPANF